MIYKSFSYLSNAKGSSFKPGTLLVFEKEPSSYYSKDVLIEVEENQDGKPVFVYETGLPFLSLEPVEETIEETIEEPVEEIIQETIEEPIEKSIEELIEESIQEAIEETNKSHKSNKKGNKK